VKLLLVRLSAIGDVIHTLPLLPPLARAGMEVAWLVEPAGLPLVDAHPLLRHVVRAPAARRFTPGAARHTRAELRALDAEVALDLQGLWKSAAWTRVSGAPRCVGWAGDARREPASALLLGETIPRPSGLVHVIDQNLALLRAVGVDAVGERAFVLPSLAREEAAVEARLAERGWRDVVLLNPGGGWAGKTWPAASFGGLAAALRARGLTPVVTWGPGEEALADQVVAASGGIAERCFATTLRELAALAGRARLLVAADTGPLHLACAVGTPVVALFGPTDPLRNGPFSPADLVVRRVPPCAPCHRRQCARHAGVMAEIPVAEVLRAIDARLAGTARA
jgi:ADP-heptose:LPS heptosyltransferase